MVYWEMAALALLGCAAAVGAAYAARRLGGGKAHAGRAEPSLADGAEGAEYAELYSTKQRVAFIAITLGLLLPLMVVMERVGFPALEEVAETAHCRELFGVPGTTVLIYALFAGLPLGCAALLGLPSAWRGWRGWRIIRDGQNPPRGARVFKPTRIRRGARARLAGYAHMLPLVFFVGLAVWGLGPAARMVADADAAAANPDPGECAGVAQDGSAGGWQAMRVPSTVPASMR